MGPLRRTGLGSSHLRDDPGGYPRHPMHDCFLALCRAAEGIDLADPQAARAELTRRLDPAGAAGLRIAADLEALYRSGEIAQRGEEPVRWSRVAKAGPGSLDFSIDAVVMTGPGPLHRHPQGEANFCVALEGQPTFEGQGPGWVVLPPGSTHVPTVAGGRMLIVYLLPQGAIEFLERA